MESRGFKRCKKENEKNGDFGLRFQRKFGWNWS